MNIKKTLLFISVLIFQVSTQARLFEISETGPDVRIPSELWKKIGGDEGKDTVTFSTLKVRLVEVTKGVLVDPVVEIQMPRGGGEIDLSQFVRGDKGTFQVFFDLEEMPDEEKLQAYFVSRARKRKIDNEVWGSGCHKYMDIRSFILKDGKKKGIEVNVTRNRHLSVLGGSFVFAMAKQVTQVNFTDSHQPHLFCGSSEVK